LIRKNDELALLYEKIKIQQSTLAKGETQYWERINDIKLLNQKIRDLEREKKIYSKQVEFLSISLVLILFSLKRFLI